MRNTRPVCSPGFQWCFKCGEKPESEFYPDKRAKTGFCTYCKSCCQNRRQVWHSNNPKKHRDYTLRYKYGVEPEEYKRLFDLQLGFCAICKMFVVGKPLCIDHDHKTGKVRALLCDACNSLIGLANENPVILQRAIAYLEAHE